MHLMKGERKAQYMWLYSFLYLKDRGFLHNHTCSRSKDILSKEGKILMVCGDYLFS